MDIELFNKVCAENWRILDLQKFLSDTGYSYPSKSWYALFKEGTLYYDRFNSLVYKAVDEGMTVTVLDSEYIQEVEDKTGKKTCLRQEFESGRFVFVEVEL